MARPQVLLFNCPFNLLHFNRDEQQITIVTRNWDQQVSFRDQESAGNEFEHFINQLIYKKKTASQDIFAQASYWVGPGGELIGKTNSTCLRKKALQKLVFTRECMHRIEDRSQHREQIDVFLGLKHSEPCFKVELPVKGLVDLLHYCIYEQIPTLLAGSTQEALEGQADRIDTRKCLNSINIKYPVLTF